MLYKDYSNFSSLTRQIYTLFNISQTKNKKKFHNKTHFFLIFSLSMVCVQSVLCAKESIWEIAHLISWLHVEFVNTAHRVCQLKQHNFFDCVWWNQEKSVSCPDITCFNIVSHEKQSVSPVKQTVSTTETICFIFLC